MPVLVGFADPAEDSPGFLLPLFRGEPGDNVDLVQVVGHADEVLGFNEVVPPGSLIRPTTDALSVAIGEPALWAFKDHVGTIHVGNAAQMVNWASVLLAGAELLPWPLLRFELGSFRDPGPPDAELAQAAYASVREESGHLVSQIWRDTQIFAPAVRRDVQHRLGKPLLWNDRERLVVLLGKHLNVFVAPNDLPLLNGVDWSGTRHVLGFFGLKCEVQIRLLSDLTPSDVALPEWRIFGVGGVAKYVVTAPPFAGRSHHLAQGGAGIIAAGTLAISPGSDLPTSQVVAVCQCAQGQLEEVADEARAFPPHSFVRHVVNVRPFGFGSPPPRKITVDQLKATGQSFDHAWIIAGHRQRRTGHAPNQQSVTNAASRLVRSLLLSLVRRADLISNITEAGLSSLPSLNLFGSLGSHGARPEPDVVRRLVHSMLCEEALLHTADRIVVLAPAAKHHHTLEVKLGNHRYNVEVQPDPRRDRSRGLVAWAITVDLPKGVPDEFIDFCIGLLDGYGWDFRGLDGGALLFEDEGEALRIWPAHLSGTVRQLISEPAPYGHSVDVILTAFTIPADWQRRATDMEWTLLHYSDLAAWLRENFPNGRLELFMRV